jgi:A/G-specific adenine glycosylase
MHPISNKLIKWYHKNKRDLPWRNISDPYKIWLSEIILQQTQVAQGLNYYIKFTETFDTITDLAKAPDDQIMRLWQGLGYYSRARNLHFAAKTVESKYNGIFPSTYESIKELKGVGDYTAAAISSFAYNLPYAVVDGNVYRVLSRIFNLDTPINSSKGKKEFQQLADEILDKKRASDHNSAIMEFGALFCRPQNPKCNECVVNVYCMAYQSNTVDLLPVKEKKIKIRSRYFSYFVINYKESIYIKKRTDNDIWKNLYEFFLIESSQNEEIDSLLQNRQEVFFSNNLVVKKTTTLKKHILSHQHIYATFYEIELNKAINLEGYILIKRNDLNNFAIPQLLTKYLTLTEY